MDKLIEVMNNIQKNYRRGILTYEEYIKYCEKAMNEYDLEKECADG